MDERVEKEIIAGFTGDHRFLSNFWHVPFGFEYGGAHAATAEHHYQAAKTLDPDERAAILAMPTPSRAKRYGSKVEVRKDWEEIKTAVMLTILIAKFSRPDVATFLLATGDAKLVESNTWHDTYWGACFCDDCKGAGTNNLGILLMGVRSELMRRADLRSEIMKKSNLD